LKLKSLMILLVFTTVSLPVFAQYRAKPTMFLSPSAVTARVQNFWGHDVYCRGHVMIQTRQGFPIQAIFDAFIPSGQFREVSLFTSRRNPFSEASSDIICSK